MDEKVSSIWIERVIELHTGPVQEVRALLGQYGLEGADLAMAVDAWQRQHEKPAASPAAEEDTPPSG